MDLISRTVRRVASPAEWLALPAAFVFATCVMASIAMLKPVRDAIGAQGGISALKWMFSATFVGTLIATTAFSWASARWPRRLLLVAVYGLFAASLVAFYVLMRADIAPDIVNKTFYVWHSVFNLFFLSIFWSFMADVFTPDQAKRLFGFIVAGISVGALSGSAITATFAKTIGTTNLLLIAVAALAIPIATVPYLSRWVRRHNPEQWARAPEQALGGGMLAGMRAMFASPLMTALGGYLLLYTMIGTFFYIEQARIIGTDMPRAESAALLARMEFVTQLTALVLQLVVTRIVVAVLGNFGTLFVLPLLTIAAAITLVVWPMLSVLFWVQVVRRSVDYALARPARESLFTLVSREDRYKSKNFIDTAVYRGGDAITAWMSDAAKPLGTAALLAFALPLTIVWVALVASLGFAARRGRGWRRATASPAAPQ